MAKSPGRWYVFIKVTPEAFEVPYGFGRNSEETVKQQAKAPAESRPDWIVTYGRANWDGSRKVGE